MNRGDTFYAMLDFYVNDEPMVENAYDEIELQINSELEAYNVKKLLSTGDIKWDTITYVFCGEEKIFTGYVAYFDQNESYKLRDERLEVQLRIKMKNSGEVASSQITKLDLGDVLSNRIL